MKFTVNRRKLLGLGAGGLAMPWVNRLSAQAREITLCAYSAIFEDIYKETVISPFVEETGIKVNYVGQPTSAQTLGQLRAQKASPQIDVAILDMTVAKAGGDEEIFTYVTMSELPVMRDLYPRALINGLPGPAVTFDSIAMLYAPEKFDAPPTSWRELWNEERAGRIAIDMPPNTIGLSMTLIANHLASGGHYLESVDKGLDLLGSMAHLVQTFDPRPEIYTAIISGMVDLGAGYNARGQTYSLQTPDRIAAVLPEEGSVFQINTINLVNGSSRTDTALEFMAYALSPKAQKAFTERLFYAPTNATANVAPEALARAAATPERLEKMLDVDWVEVATIRDQVTTDFRRKVLSRG